MIQTLLILLMLALLGGLMATLVTVRYLRRRLERLESRLAKVQQRNSEAFAWGKAVGVSSAVSGKWFRFETDELVLKRLEVITTHKPSN